jgi:hypothetical protein
MIAWSMFGPDVERMVGPAGQPIGEGAVESGRATTVAEQPAPDAAPAEVPVVSFQGVTGFYGGDGAYFLVGEALNASDQNLRFVEVRASFSDGGGEVVGTGSAFVELGIVEAGSIAPFELVLLDPPRSLAGFQLRADYLTTGQSLIGLEMVRESASRDSAGRHQIAGEVRNPHEFAVKLPEVVVTYYDARHDVVAVETAFTDLETLEPGESSPFLVVLAELPATFQSYSLLTEAARE